MKIYESAVRKPISTALIFIAVVVFGLFSVMRLGVDYYPEIDVPYISVITMYPGGNAEDIETNITRVLEDQLNSVDNLDKITSQSKDNVSIITLEFEYGCDLTEAANDVRDVVSRTQSLCQYGSILLNLSSIFLEFRLEDFTECHSLRSPTFPLTRISP